VKRGVSMQKCNAKLLAPLAIVSAALLAVSGGLASAAGTPTGGEVHIYEADTALAGNLGTVILTGAVTDHGKDHQGVAGGGAINKFVLSKGSFELNVGGFALQFPVDPKTCSSAGSATATVPIVEGTGTGAYRGIRGSIRTTVTLASILPRLASGECNTSATRYPGVLLGSGSGKVSYR
jgi:hypothetical protein